MKEYNAIEVKDITKTFRIGHDNTLVATLKSLGRSRRKEARQVLKGVSFDVKKGEAIGLIGHNGCGKSTTLKLLTKIMYPDTGSIQMRGRVSSLIELGAGFHPDMSGRENIYINASIFGLSRKEIDARIGDIIAFSELEAYIDTPVRTYSSGMYMRLAFAVAINVDADILLVDEILAVGDVAFQYKCFQKLKEIKRNGTTIVIVSHSLDQLQQICDRLVWIQDGRVQQEGDIDKVHAAYIEHMAKVRQAAIEKQVADHVPLDVMQAGDTVTRWGNQKAVFTSVKLTDTEGKEKSVFMTGDTILCHLAYKLADANSPIEDAVFGVGFFDADRQRLYGTNTKLDGMDAFAITKDGEITLTLQAVNLLEGVYSLDFTIESDMSTPVDYWTRVKTIEIFSPVKEAGILHFDHTWEL